jgi:hypothetical protein
MGGEGEAEMGTWRGGIAEILKIIHEVDDGS